MMIIPGLDGELAPMVCPQCGGLIDVFRTRSGKWLGSHDLVEKNWLVCRFKQSPFSAHAPFGPYDSREQMQACLSDGPRPLPSLDTQAHVQEIIDSLVVSHRSGLDRVRRDLERLMEKVAKLEGEEVR